MACESPPRKRAKLSLKFTKNQKLFDSPTKPMSKLKLSSVNEPMKSDYGIRTRSEDDKPTLKKELVRDRDPTHPPEPYVGFYNIGNTCYLNSVLQALRYCPDFVTTLQNVLEIGEKWLDQKAEEAVLPEAKDAGNGTVHGDSNTEEREGIGRMLRLLKEMYKVFDLMRDKEDNFLLMPSVDTDMAINPEMVLESLRTVNPMFDGYLQHDAQELLCSLLSSLKEVREKVFKEMSCIDKDSINKNIPQVTHVCRTSTATKTAGTLKGGCSPSTSRSVKRSGVQTDNPVTARKHLCYSPAHGDSAVKKGSVENGMVVTAASAESESLNCTEKGDGRKGKRFRRKSMRSRPLLCETEKEPDEKNVKVGKKKSLGLKRLYKFANQPTIFSKLKILSRKKQQSSSPTPPPKASKALPLANPEVVCTEAIRKPGQMEPELLGSPPRDSSCDLDTSGTPTVIFQHQKKSESLFQGSLVLRTKCMECENYTERCEEFQDISVPVHCLKKIEDEEEGDLVQMEPPAESNDSCDVTMSQASLDWALSEFTLSERLTDTNKYFCDRCLHLTEAERFLLFDELPQVMVIHLKRFSALTHTFSPGGSIPKLNDLMVTPLSITMDRWCTKSCQQRLDTYQLLSVVSHTGSSSSSGHYLSYVRVPKLEPICTADGEFRELPEHTDRYEWVLFDDDQVTSFTDEEFEKCINHPSKSQEFFDTPYLLFYSRVAR